MRFLDSLVAPRRPVSAPARSWQAGLQDLFAFGGQIYGGGSLPGVLTSYGSTPAEPIGNSFTDLVRGALRSDSIIAAVASIRMAVFSEARFQFQRFNSGRPGQLFGTPDLGVLEHPWEGGHTSQLLSRMIIDADFGGTAFVARIGDELVRLRPDWTDIILTPRVAPVGQDGSDRRVGWRRVGYFFFDEGDRSAAPAVFLPDEVAAFAPVPDPLATYRGMSLMYAAIKEIQSDRSATDHKLKFFENAATPNLAISLPRETTKAQFDLFKATMDENHRGVDDAYKTLYLTGGADPRVIGADMQQLDFRATQGAGETRLCNILGIHPVVAGVSESLAGSSLNAGNYGAAKRQTVDRTFRPLWRDLAGSMETLVPPRDPRTGRPDPGARLWVDSRDIPFLRDDEQDLADIHSKEAQMIRTLLDAGYEPASVQAAVAAGGDWSLLVHTGYYSVQLQQLGQAAPPVVG